ncbi:rab-GTPase-TBC domain-containing protein [Schizophyllum commune]
MAVADESHPRAPRGLLRNVYQRLFESKASLAKLKDNAIADRLLDYEQGNSVCVAGRSLAWKLFLLHQEEPLDTSASLEVKPPIGSLRASRRDFVRVMLDKFKAPDGGYAEGFTVPGGSATELRTTRKVDNLEMNNPLSLHDKNPWTEWFAAMELRKTIAQDVERTFPEIDFFRDADVQTHLTDILFLYCATNPEIGYRQGMHELLAPIYYAVDFDALSEDEPVTTEDATLRELCSRTWVAADAWALFSAVMRGASQWYEWREPSLPSLPIQSTSTNGKLELKPYVSPVVLACNRIQSTLLRSIDPLLWGKVQGAGIEPQIYGIRWLRLLFTREFPLADAMRLWDGLFAYDPTLELVPWICVAMLIRIRNELIPADYSGQLTALLRYPSPPRTTLADGSLHTTLLIKQAIELQSSPSPTTGATIMMQNRNMLGIPSEVPQPPPTPPRRPARGRPKTNSYSGASPATSHAPPRGHARQGSASQFGIPEMLAKGLMERGEGLGINNIMSAVSELKKNIPELSSLVRQPLSPTGTSFALLDERTRGSRTPWEARAPRFDGERDSMADLQATNQKLGESLAWVAYTLQQGGLGAPAAEGSVTDVAQRKAKQDAMESLLYVRDILLKGGCKPSELDEERLYGEEERRRRTAAAHGRDPSLTQRLPAQSSEAAPAPSAVPTPPMPRVASEPSSPATSTIRPASLPTSRRDLPPATMPRRGIPAGVGASRPALPTAPLAGQGRKAAEESAAPERRDVPRDPLGVL